MRMARKPGHIVDASEGDIGGGELLRQHRGVERARHRGDLVIGLGAALDAGAVGGESGIGGERGIAQDFFREHPPFAVVLHADEDIGAVTRRECAVGRDRGMGEPDALRRLARFLLHQRHRHPVGHGVEQRYRKRGTLAVALPRQQSFQDRLVRIQSGGDVDGRHADARWLRRAGDRGEADFGLNEQIVGLAPGKRTALAEAGDRAADEARIVAPQPGDGKPKLPHRAGLEVLHEDVGAPEHRFEQRLVAGLGEIEHHRFLAAVEPDEIAALAVREVVVGAGEIAFRPLDLDHARPGIREPACAHRRGDSLFERDDEKSGQGEGHGFLYSRRRRPFQYDRGRPSTCSARYDKTRLVEIGATR